MMKTDTTRFRLGQTVDLATLGTVRIVRIKPDAIWVQSATINLDLWPDVKPWLLGFTSLTPAAFSTQFRAAQKGPA